MRPAADAPAPAPAAEDLDTLRLQVLADDPECYRALYDLAPTTPAAIRAILDAWRAQDAEEADDAR